MKYRITWFDKETKLVQSEGTYDINLSLVGMIDYYQNNLIEGNDCCIMEDPDNFPHTATSVDKIKKF
jgi:hypothetical protein